MNSKRLRSNLALSLGLSLGLASALPMVAQGPGPTLPFSADEDKDGARWVWFILGKAGFPYEYLPAKDLQTSPRFAPCQDQKPQAGDIAWWKEYAAIYAGPEAPPTANLITAPGRVSLQSLEKKYGPVKWLRAQK